MECNAQQCGEGDGGLRILFVDDDPILREFAKVYLAPLGAEVESAADGAAALAMLHARTFHMVLTDVQMPGLDGLALTREIRRCGALSHLPVVVVTGHDDVLSIDRAYDAGATSFVAKPVNWHQLIHQVRFVQRAAALERELRSAREAAEVASQMKGNVIRAVQHELRTPLNAVIGYAQLLKDQLGAGGDPRLIGYAGEVERGGMRLVGLFDNMMATARLATGDAILNEDDYDLCRIMARALESVSMLVDAPGPVLLSPALEGIRLACDRDMMALLFQHLIANAVSHGAGGICTIRPVCEPGRGLAIEVIDEGAGMAAEALAAATGEAGLAVRSQDNFLHRSTGGLGLGIATARLVAEKHGASLTWERGACGGTIVRVLLPQSRVLQLPKAVAA